MECPRCRAAAMQYQGVEVFRCPVCGFDPLRDDLPAAPLIAGPRRAPPPAPATRPVRRISRIAPVPDGPIAIDLPNQIDLGDLSALSGRARARVEGRLHEAQVALGRGDRQAARAALKVAIETHDDSDALWLCLAALAETREEQRALLEETLARNPYHPVATEALLRLDGRLEPPPAPPDRPLEPGQVPGQHLACPLCGGALIYDAAARDVICQSCGQRVADADALPRAPEPTLLQIGLLRRQRQMVPWQIGPRWLRCTECGAITTLAHAALSTTCRFCGSQQIVQESAHLRFQQPDLIIPFALDEARARARVQAHLTSGLRRLTRLFADAVTRIDLQGVYLPFWIFDAEMSVNWAWSNAPDRGVWPVLLGNVLHFAGETPSRRLLEKVEPFDFMGAVDYDPRLIAVFPAALYAIDVDRASIDVRTRLVRLAESRARPSLQARKPSGGYGSGFGGRLGSMPTSPFTVQSYSRAAVRFSLSSGTVSVGGSRRDDAGRLELQATTRGMSYRFGLLPVWIGRLMEADRDTQTVLVNGQTGEVVLGEHEKAETPPTPLRGRKSVIRPLSSS